MLKHRKKLFFLVPALLLVPTLLLVAFFPRSISTRTKVTRAATMDMPTPLNEDQLEALAQQAGFAPESVLDTMTAIAQADGTLQTLADFQNAFVATEDGENFSGFAVFKSGAFLQFMNEGGPLLDCEQVLSRHYELYSTQHLIGDKDHDQNHLIPNLWKLFSVRVGYAHQPVSRLYCTYMADSTAGK